MYNTFTDPACMSPGPLYMIKEPWQQLASLTFRRPFTAKLSRHKQVLAETHGFV